MPKKINKPITQYEGYRREVFIVDANRTPFFKALGGPGLFSAADLAVQAARTLLLRQPFEPSDLDEVITGCVMPSMDETNISRIIALRLGCGHAMPAWTVQRNCASGMQAIDNAAQDIASGRADLVLAGGTEAMSRAPLLWNESMVRWLANWSNAKTLSSRLKTLVQLRPYFLTPVIALLRGLTDPIVGLSMGQTAENLAYRFNISRQQMDEFAFRSHQRLAKAQDEGWLDEVSPMFDFAGHEHATDEGLRRDTSLEKLSRLKPIFDKKFGTVTAGNSSQVTDGAAYLLLASEEAVKKYHLKPQGKIVDVEWAGVDPAQMGLGPVNAATHLMQRRNLALTDIDYWEINEAFAAQVLACLAAWNDEDYCRENFGLKTPVGQIDQEKLNVDGGAIAIGHPVGASGARIVMHLLEILQRKHAKRGIASLCIGGGQGGAMLIENAAV